MSDVVERAKDALSLWDKTIGVEIEITYGMEAAKEAYENAPEMVRELVAEIERLHSWQGLMSLLDEHYPESIFPTTEDREDRDPGPRIVSLIRQIDELKTMIKLLKNDVIIAQEEG